MSKKTKTKLNKWLKKVKPQFQAGFNLGGIDPQQGKILSLLLAIVFVTSWLIISQVFIPTMPVDSQPQVAGVSKNALLEKEINKMVEGYPIEKMTPYIFKQDPKVAAFMIAIAKKESAWGKRKPVLNGEDCYNYWGFRLKTEKMGSGGHTCFDSPREAVATIGSRIDQLVKEEEIDTPEEMVIWKCGYACDGPEASGSEKWISDVAMYYDKMEQKM